MDEQIRKFIDHNLRIWERPVAEDRPGGEVLFEFNPGPSSIIAFSYLANVLRSKFKAKLVAYSFFGTSRQPLLVRILRRLFRSAIPSTEKRIFESFGTTSFFAVEPAGPHRDRAAGLFEQVYPPLRTKQDLENLVVEGVWIGDLIYDTYLMRYAEPTIDIQDRQFVDFLRESLEMFCFWQDYFDTHEVRAINVTHCVYNNAIPLRIAVQKGIPVYQTNATHVYRMNADNLFAYGEYKYYPEMFGKLFVQERIAGKREAQRRIERRFAGKVGVDMPYSTKSAYGEMRSRPALRPSDKFKVLIAAHCFFDSPHSYGNNLFPDFYEWFEFLGRISNETDYDWYVKTHPDFLPGNTEILNRFIKKYPKFTLLDATTSHHQLITEGINCALTTYGTIGFEYAALDVPVVNASVCNPHIAYHFNLHPKSVQEYEHILRHLGSQTIKIDKEEVYEYYYMRFIHNSKGWLFDDYQMMLNRLGGYAGQFTPQAYAYFLETFSEARHRQALMALQRFVDSGDFCLSREHLGHGLSESSKTLALSVSGKSRP